MLNDPSGSVRKQQGRVLLLEADSRTNEQGEGRQVHQEEKVEPEADVPVRLPEAGERQAGTDAGSGTLRIPDSSGRAPLADVQGGCKTADVPRRDGLLRLADKAGTRSGQRGTSTVRREAGKEDSSADQGTLERLAFTDSTRFQVHHETELHQEKDSRCSVACRFRLWNSTPSTPEADKT